MYDNLKTNSRKFIRSSVDGSPGHQGQAPAAEPADQVVPGPRHSRRLPRVQASSSGKHLLRK